MQRSFRKVFQFELLERREQPNDVFSLGGSLLFGLDSGFWRDPAESRSQYATDLPALVSDLTPAAVPVADGSVLASPTDFAGPLPAAPAPAAATAALQDVVEAVTTLAALSGTGPLSLLEATGNEVSAGSGGSRGSWLTNPEIPVANGLSQTTTVADASGILYVIGGGLGASPFTRINDVRKYDPSTQTWTRLAPIPYPQGGSFYDSAAFVANGGAGSIYVFGGALGSGGGVTITNQVYKYDIGANTWAAVAPLPNGPRFGPCVSELFGYIFVSGGNNGTAAQNDFNLYDTYTDTWYTGLPPAPPEVNAYRQDGAFVYWDNGGTLELQHHCLSGVFSSRFHHVFDLNTFAWTVRPLMPFGVTDPGLAAAYNLTDGYHQTIFVAGGVGENANRVQKYNIRTQTWSNAPNLPGPTNNTSAALSNYYELFVMGGYDGTTSIPVNYSFPAAYDL